MIENDKSADEDEQSTAMGMGMDVIGNEKVVDYSLLAGPSKATILINSAKEDISGIADKIDSHLLIKNKKEKVATISTANNNDEKREEKDNNNDNGSDDGDGDADRNGTERLINAENKSAHNMYMTAAECNIKRETSIRSMSVTSFGNLSEDDEGEGEDEEGDNFDIDSSDVEAASSGNQQTSTEDGIDYSQLDRYGFIIVAPREKTPPGQSDEERDLRRRQEKRGRMEARRAMKWIEMLKTLEPISDRREWPRSMKKFETRLLKGIPECLRTKVWAMFLQVLINNNSPNPNYRDLYLKISGFERQIDLDIERTLRDHILFKARFSSAQVSLFKVLVAYSNFDPEVGYCQGMSTIAAFLLLYFEEECAFTILQKIMTRDGLRTLFTSGFPLLFETFYVQEQLMRKYLSALHARLDSFHITLSVYATKWYLTLFLGFPFALATRLWDLFLFWGLDMLVCVSLALLKMHESRLMSLEYEAAMQFLSKLPDAPMDENRLINLTWKIWKRIYPSFDDVDRERSERKNPFRALRTQYGKLHLSERRKHH